MTTYYEHGIALSAGQKESLSKALASRSGITLRLSNSELNDSDKLLLTKTQIDKLRKVKAQGKGADLKLSKAQVQNMVQKGGSLISTLLSLGTRALPFATKFATKVIPGLATGALSSLGNFGMDKIPEQGQTGGFMIPQNKIDKLIVNKSLLTKKQKEQIMAALQTGGKLVIRPTPRQRGGALGTILASIGIPMLMNALLGKGLQNRRPPTSKGGKGLQNRRPPSSMALVPYRPPPFIGNWGDNTLGLGLRRVTKPKTTKPKPKSKPKPKTTKPKVTKPKVTKPKTTKPKVTKLR